MVLRQANKVTNACLHAPISRVCRGVCANHATLARSQEHFALRSQHHHEQDTLEKMTFFFEQVTLLAFCLHITVRTYIAEFPHTKDSYMHKQTISASLLRLCVQYVMQKTEHFQSTYTLFHTLSLPLPVLAFCCLF